MASVKPKEVRQARAFLRQRKIETQDISPRLFAMTAKKTGKTFLDLLKTIARLKMGGQGVGQSEKADEVIGG